MGIYTDNPSLQKGNVRGKLTDEELFNFINRAMLIKQWDTIFHLSAQ